MLARVYEFREELKVFLTNESSDYTKLLASDEWCARLAYLAFIFHHLNEMNTRMQGRNENLLTSTDKINGFRSKVHLWQQHVESTNLDMFPLTKKWHDVNTASLCEIIGKHLKTLEEKLSFYFPSTFTDCLDWVRDPYSSASVVGKDMTLQEQEELTELRQGTWFKTKFCQSTFGQFLVDCCQGVPHSSKQSYFNIAPIFISSIPARISSLCSSKHAQISHRVYLSFYIPYSSTECHLLTFLVDGVPLGFFSCKNCTLAQKRLKNTATQNLFSAASNVWELERSIANESLILSRWK